MTTHSEYKAAKEAFVSGTVGAPAQTTYALWTALAPRIQSQTQSWIVLLSEFSIVVLPLLLVLTVLSSVPLYLNTLLAAITLTLRREDSIKSRQHATLPSPIGSPATPSKSSFGASAPSSPHMLSPGVERPVTHGPILLSRQTFSKPFVTVYRAHMMLMTIMCILAVDFKAFPREFAKTETWGTSIVRCYLPHAAYGIVLIKSESKMDLGVGSFVFSLGLVAAHPLLKSRQLPPIMAALFTSFRRSASIIALGLVRVLMVKGVDYPEHVSEYGVHWNFFFTLALVPFLGALLDRIAIHVEHAWLAIIITALHQMALSRTQLQYWALTAARTNIVSQNREGLVSLPGYLSIYLLGVSTGIYVLPPDPYFHSRLRPDPAKQHSPRQAREIEKKLQRSLEPKPGKLVSVLGSYVVVWWTLFYVLGLSGFTVSRRLANTMYVIWVAAFNTAFLLGYLLVQLWSPTNPAPDGIDSERAPAIFGAINRNGLVVFLFANVLTGLVNVATETMYASDAQAIFILVAYSLAIVLVAWAARTKRWRI